MTVSLHFYDHFRQIKTTVNLATEGVLYSNVTKRNNFSKGNRNRENKSPKADIGTLKGLLDYAILKATSLLRKKNCAESCKQEQ